jgi:pimeloyl-ACP methyl ester carboxylesterase
MAILRTPSGRTVKVIERGNGTAAVFLHSGVGSAGEWREVFSRWPEGYRLIAVDAYRGGDAPGAPGHRTLDHYADQVHAVVNHVGGRVHLIGFSWGGATGLHVAVTRPEVLASLTVVEPDYSLLRTEDTQAYAEIAELRDRWREHVRTGRWHEAFAEFRGLLQRTGLVRALATRPPRGVPRRPTRSGRPLGRAVRRAADRSGADDSGRSGARDRGVGDVRCRPRHL